MDENNLHAVGLNTMSKVCESHGDKKKLTKVIMRKADSIELRAKGVKDAASKLKGDMHQLGDSLAEYAVRAARSDE